MKRESKVIHKHNLIGLIALVVLVVALPIYAMLEPGRMERAAVGVQRQYLDDGAIMYVQNCAHCHGTAGEGLGAMPALNNPGLAEADYNLLYRTIAHSPHGTTMAAWHVEEGGNLNDYQVAGLVTLIQAGNWTEVARVAFDRGIEVEVPSPTETAELLQRLEEAGMSRTDDLLGADEEAALMDVEDQADPHACVACHEEPEMHAERFGLNCARCHGLTAWKPALLLRHTFLLDHGGEGQVACETCHVDNYFEHTCYGCHDHQPDDMREAHYVEGILEYEACVACHPTGREGEGEMYRNSYQAHTLPTGPLASTPAGGFHSAGVGQ